MKRPRPLPPSFALPDTPANLPVRRCPVPRAQASLRILIVRAGAFGDILMGTPLLSALRNAYPACHITWLAEHSERQAIDANPLIDEVIVWNSGFWKQMVRRGLWAQWLWHALRFRRVLREKHYDVFVSFQPEEWPLLTRSVGASVRIGVFDTFQRFNRNRPTSPRTRFYTHSYSQPDKHRVEQYLLTLEALGLPDENISRRMTMGYTAEDRTLMQAFLQAAGVADSERLIVLAPLTTWPAKCWPADRFALLGTRLAANHNARLVLIGSAKEQQTVQTLAAQMQTSTPPVVAAGSLTFRQMAALIDRADLLVSGDTGPMHVAAAVGTPHVSLFGATAARWYGPLDSESAFVFHPVPCGPCDQKQCPNTGDAHELCLKLITVDEVQAASNRLFKPAPLLPSPSPSYDAQRHGQAGRL